MGDADINYDDDPPRSGAADRPLPLQSLLVARRLFERCEADRGAPLGAAACVARRRAPADAPTSPPIRKERIRLATGSGPRCDRTPTLPARAIRAAARRERRRRRTRTAPRSGCRGTAARRDRPTPAAAFSAYRTGISWQTTSTRSGLALGQARERLRVAERRVVEALAARKRPLAAELPLHLAVARERRALELADLDVVEPRLDLDRDVAGPPSASSAVSCVRGKRVCTQRSSSTFASCAPSSLASSRPLLGERRRRRTDRRSRALEVQHRLGVPGEEDDQGDGELLEQARRSRSARTSGASRCPRAPSATETLATVSASGASTMFRKS